MVCRLVESYQLFLVNKVELLRFSEAAATLYQSALSNIPSELNLQQHDCENLKSSAI